MKEKLLEMFNNKKVGFYVNLASILLLLVTAIVYVIGYSASRYMAWATFALLLAGVVIGVALLLIRKEKYIGLTSLVTSFFAFLVFAYYIYFFVSSVLVGIQYSEFPPEFIITVVLLVLTIGTSVAGVFFSQEKNTKALKFKTARTAMSVVSFLLCGVLLVGTVIANENFDIVSKTLGHDTTKMIETNENLSLEDTLYFKSEFKKWGDVIANGTQQAYNVVAEGAVLLKNDNNALPLSKGNKVTLFGVGAYNPVYGGTGSGGISTSDAIDFVKSFEDAGLVVNPTMKENYLSSEWKQHWRSSSGNMGSTVVKINEVPWNLIEEKVSNTFAEYGDAAVMVISRIGGEGYDLTRPSDGIDNSDGLGADYLGLNQNELDMINNLKVLKEKGVFKKVVVIINYSSMIEGDFLKGDGVDAALWIGAPGMGNGATGDLLVGNVNPSGRLSDTMWMDNAKNPVNVNFKFRIYENADEFGINKSLGTDGYSENTMASYVVYQEGMYLGYRYTETRYEDVVLGTPNVGEYNYKDVVAYPFGHGLSYTTFDYSDLSIEKQGERDYVISIKVTNTGDKDGKVSVPVWISKPYNDYAKDNGIQVPSVELLDFGKTKILAAGESETLTITVDEKFFASYDANKAKGYVLLGGDYYVAVGGSSHEAINNVLAAKKADGVAVDESKMVGNGDASFVKKFNIEFNKDKYRMSDVASSLDGEIKEVTNLFDFSDINKYTGRGSNSVEYYSREAWDKVSFDMVNGYAKLLMTEQMAIEVFSQVPEEVGKYNNAPHVPEKYKQPIPEDDIEYPTMGKDSGIQLIKLMYDENGEPISFNDPIWDDFLDQLTWDDLVNLCGNSPYGTASVAAVGKPSTSDEDGPNGFRCSALVGANIKSSLFYLTEREKGNVNEDGTLIMKQVDPDGRLNSTGFPSNGVLAATFNRELARKVGEAIGECGLWAGKSGIYGTGLNIHRSPYLGRTSEYYSECGMLTGLIGAVECSGIESKGVHVYNKHCALNDMEFCRHGVQTWAPEQAVREIYLRAFELPITKGGAFNVMAAFSRFGTYTSPACKELITDFLRGECGLKGIVLTDAYTDMNGSQNIDPYYEQIFGLYHANCDVPLSGAPKSEGHFDKFESGYGKMAWAMRDAAKRVCYAALWSNAMNGISSTTEFVDIMPTWQKALYILDVSVSVVFIAAMAWMVVAFVKEKKNK